MIPNRLENILYSNYIKYSRLHQLCIECFNNTHMADATKVNIYIDTYSIFIPLFYRVNDFSVVNHTIPTSSVINLCAHIRAFFHGMGVETKIFIIDSMNYYNRFSYELYNDKIYIPMINNPTIGELIKINTALLRILVPYFHDIHFISRPVESGVLMYDIFVQERDKGNSNPNIIYSKDQYLYQLPVLMSDTFLFRPKKDMDKSTGTTEDISWSVNKENALVQFACEGRRSDPSKWTNINPELLSLVMTLNNCPSRGIKSIFNISSTLKLLNKMLSECYIQNGYSMYVDKVYDYIARDRTVISDSGGTTYNKPLFRARFRSIDILSQHPAYLCTPDRVTNYDINLYDPETVKSINNEYFKNNPLDLNRL